MIILVGRHLIQGIGAGIIPANLDLSILDEIIQVSSQDLSNSNVDEIIQVSSQDLSILPFVGCYKIETSLLIRSIMPVHGLSSHLVQGSPSPKL
ncbi:hypothetical protein YC2023_048073 [Brassica napus]